MPPFRRRTHETFDNEAKLSNSSGEVNPGRDGSGDEVKMSPHHRYGFAHELNPDFLSYMLKRHEQDKGKFVRYGDMILVAPLEERRGGNKKTVMHRDLAERSAESKDENFKGRLNLAISEGLASENQLFRGSGIVDAGKFKLDTDEQGIPTKLYIGGWSNLYGQAKPPIRQETLELARQALGTDIEVEQDDHLVQ